MKHSCALLFCLCFSTGLFAKSEEKTPTEKPDDLHFFTGAFSAAFRPEKAANRDTDTSLVGGVLFSLRGGDQFFYGAGGAIFLRHQQNEIRKTDTDRAALLPGNFFAGLRFGKSRGVPVDLFLGRKNFHEESSILYLWKGNPAGIHLDIHAGAAGNLRISPVYLPSFSPGYLSGNMSETLSAVYGPEKWKMDLENQKGQLGHAVRYAGNTGFLFYSAGYALYTIPSSTGRSERDRLSYSDAGAGIHLSGEKTSFEFFFSLEHCEGSLSSLLRGEKGDYRSRVSGSSLWTGLDFHYSEFRAALFFFLPETERFKAPSTTGAPDRTGYIGRGDSPLRSPLLTESLGASPFPLISRQSPEGYASDHITPGEYSHAALLSPRLEYRGRFQIGAQAFFWKPLADATEAKNPFAKVKADEKSAFTEYTFDAAMRFEGEGELRLVYSRLVFESVSDGQRSRRLAGESFQFMLKRRF